jgi:hypothetical protein
MKNTNTSEKLSENGESPLIAGMRECLQASPMSSTGDTLSHVDWYTWLQGISSNPSLQQKLGFHPDVVYTSEDFNALAGILSHVYPTSTSLSADIPLDALRDFAGIQGKILVEKYLAPGITKSAGGTLSRITGTRTRIDDLMSQK